MTECSNLLHKNILIIEDDFSIRDILTTVLMSEHYSVRSCNIKHCFKSYRHWKPTIVIIAFPSNKSREEKKVVFQIVKKYKYERVPILISSTDPKDRDAAKKFGGTDFLEEPFDVDAFLQKINSLSHTS